ncbi:alpha/beta-hydrolase, partial [Tilletiaria anomala UBC 951]
SHLHNGTPTGTLSTVAGLETYVASGGSGSDAEVKAVILFVADVFGISLNNNKILCDKYASELSSSGSSVKVYLPDFLGGEDLIRYCPTPEAMEKLNISEYVASHHPREAGWEKVDKVLAELRSKHPNAKFGAVGYCWGAPSCLHAGSSKTQQPVDAIAFAHGSLVQAEDFETVIKPGLYITPEHDHQWTEELYAKTKETTNRLAKEKHVFSKWVYYPHVKHGFAIRGDEEDAYSARCMADAAQEIVAHFKLELL